MSLESADISDARSFVKREDITSSSLEAEIFAQQIGISMYSYAPEHESPYFNKVMIIDGNMVFSDPQIPAESVGKLLSNEAGDQYKINRMGQVTEFTYMENGNIVQTITNVRRDMEGLVVEFTDRDGTNWVKQHRAPDNGKWYAKNSADTSAFYVAVDLGEVRLRSDGLHISGKDRAKVYLPSK
ncbi:MAG: hypothetical protein C0507_16430 [Cyanobacteria bacterium PR.3.49]|nr:hypothetical protein [Cyanobacteria bacterium PR.3.49]